MKNQKVVKSLLKSIGKDEVELNNQQINVSIVNLNNRTVDNDLNLRLLSLQGLKGNVNLITKKRAEKENIETDNLKSVKLFIANGDEVIRYYTAFITKEEPRKKLDASKVSVVPLKNDNTRNKGSLIDSVTSLLKSEKPVVQYAGTETRIDSLEVKLNRIENLLETLLKKKK